jgi:hypothetical protein
VLRLKKDPDGNALGINPGTTPPDPATDPAKEAKP